MKLWPAFAVGLGLCLSAVAGDGLAQSWSSMATISGTLGNNTNRLCVGAPSAGRPDIGCPADAPSVMSGTLVAQRVSSSLISSTYIQLSSATDVLACNSARSGAMRYSSNTVQVCNGTYWASVGGSVGGSGGSPPIFCRRYDAVHNWGTVGMKSHDFNAGQCGGVLPGANYYGTLATVSICGETTSLKAKQPSFGESPGVEFYLATSSCGASSELSVVYIHKDGVAPISGTTALGDWSAPLKWLRSE